MKKVIVMVACLLAIGAASAQEKNSGLMFSGGFGMSNYGNFPSVSVFADQTDAYGLIPSEQISVGYCHNKSWFVGLTLNYDNGSTSFQNLNERFKNTAILFDIRDYYPLGDKFELEVGAATGWLIRNNSFDYVGDHYSFTRHGFIGYFSLGLNYLFKEGHTIGVRAILPCYGWLQGEKPALPTGLVANEQNRLSGYGIQLSYGVMF